MHFRDVKDRVVRIDASKLINDVLDWRFGTTKIEAPLGAFNASAQGGARNATMRWAPGKWCWLSSLPKVALHQFDRCAE